MELEVKEIGEMFMVGYAGMEVIIKAFDTEAKAMKYAARYIAKHSVNGGTVNGK